jgi:alkanesulfonate monooxygenase SsuD/methylene tetrahydromethanopterin reductase-like flavin-dependent oxidoreductase (luciferase family)
MAVSFQVSILPNRPLNGFVDWIAKADELIRRRLGRGFAVGPRPHSAALFARCRRMDLATGVTNIDPPSRANSFATLDGLSGGRAVGGVGGRDPPRPEAFPAGSAGEVVG